MYWTARPSKIDQIWDLTHLMALPLHWNATMKVINSVYFITILYCGRLCMCGMCVMWVWLNVHLWVYARCGPMMTTGASSWSIIFHAGPNWKNRRVLKLRLGLATMSGQWSGEARVLFTKSGRILGVVNECTDLSPGASLLALSLGSQA